eukprot:TRINITY_DN6247_c0_g1_i1.p2 TRINITY_DN6247_c0_g1~~TRINITY_DN6247_c0_g1_i1.p2  ORF type:complete len:74 (-),score=40.70 TRINITY_DN6247_c0_g1_i1:2-223(-)
MEEENKSLHEQLNTELDKVHNLSTENKKVKSRKRSDRGRGSTFERGNVLLTTKKEKSTELRGRSSETAKAHRG